MFAWNVNILHRCPVAILDYVHHIGPVRYNYSLSSQLYSTDLAI